MTDITWTDLPPDTGAAPTRDFMLRHRDGSVPGALWLPAAGAPKALLLVGHGGSRHKRAPTTLTFIGEAVERRGFAVAAIDGPLHGARRGADRSADPADTQMDFRNLWATPGNGIAGMTADWRAALAALRREAALSGLPVGYFGLSMGTAYGLPFVAAEPRVGAAVLGMWGANYPNSAPLVEAAGRVRCPVFFMHKTEDHFFTLDGAFAIYGALPGEDKRMLLSPGPHAEATAEQIELALTFFTRRLAG
jgi:dienelactone hydrolase